MNVLIIEDEKVSAKKLVGYLSELRPKWKILKVLSGVNESIRYLKTHPEPDLIFLDVQLSDGVSLRIFDEIRVHSYVIFLTAYDKYALEAFNLNSVDYLLKPFTKQDAEKSLTKLDAFIYNKHGMSSLIKQQSKGGYQERFLVKKGNTYYTILSEDIAYFFKDELLFLVTKDGAKFLFDVSLEELKSKLDPQKFFRVNRQFMVSYEAIQNLKPASSNRLKLVLVPDFGSTVFVSQGKVSALKEWLAE